MAPPGQEAKMVCFDETAGVYEVYSDANATEWLGAYGDYASARRALNAFLATRA